MTSFAQGQPFNTGAVWDQMRFGTEQSAGTMPMAGSYMDQLRTLFSSIPSDINKDDRALYGLMGVQSLNAAESAKQNRALMQDWMTYQREASERANEMGIRNQVIGSFLKDVPAAIGGAVRARNAYLPEQIQIAAAGAGRGIPSVTSPNYYGFVR